MGMKGKGEGWRRCGKCGGGGSTQIITYPWFERSSFLRLHPLHTLHTFHTYSFSLLRKKRIKNRRVAGWISGQG
jgi:hypothetical protein